MNLTADNIESETVDELVSYTRLTEKEKSIYKYKLKFKDSLDRCKSYKEQCESLSSIEGLAHLKRDALRFKEEYVNSINKPPTLVALNIVRSTSNTAFHAINRYNYALFRYLRCLKSIELLERFFDAPSLALAKEADDSLSASNLEGELEERFERESLQ